MPAASIYPLSARAGELTSSLPAAACCKGSNVAHLGPRQPRSSAPHPILPRVKGAHPLTHTPHPDIPQTHFQHPLRPVIYECCVGIQG